VQFFEADYDHINTDGFPPETLRVLENINRKVAAHESLDSLMNFLFESTIQICNCDRIWLAFVQEAGQRAVVKWSRATYTPVLLDKGYTIDIRLSYLKRVVQHQQVCLIDDLKRHLAEHPDISSSKVLVEEGARSLMVAPLVLDGQTVALLFRSRRQPRAFSERSVRQNLATAERISQAVDVAYKMEELEQAIKSYMEMLGFISHELKSPLSSIIMDGRIVAEGYLGSLKPAQREKIEKIISKSEYLLGLVREYLDLARIEGGQLQLHAQKNVDFGQDIVEPALELVKSQLEKKQMVLSWNHEDQPLLVEVDRQLLKIVMINLLSNAIKYGHQHGDIRITSKLKAGELEVAVWNEGFGFLEKHKPLLFKKFSRLESSRSAHERGTGVGLFTSWKIIRLHGGTIQGESQYGQWAKFTFRIPQPPRIPNGSTPATGDEEE